MKEIQNIWPVGIRKTKQRESVLSVLEDSEQPLSASDICSQIAKNGEAVWLSTVYRILELFVNKDIAVYAFNRFQHRHYAACMNCHKMIAMNNCPMEKFAPKFKEDGFHVMGHNLKIYGFCKDCNPKQ